LNVTCRERETNNPPVALLAKENKNKVVTKGRSQDAGGGKLMGDGFPQPPTKKKKPGGGWNAFEKMAHSIGSENLKTRKKPT